VADAFRLGIDFGTSNTVAMLASGERIRPLLFDGSPLLASAVFAGAGSRELLVGADAVRAAVGSPSGLEANPKRRISDRTVWLGERDWPVVDLIAAVLGRVRSEAERVAGRMPERVILTHPAAWARVRLGVLADAARQASLGAVRFVPEPIAAAAYFATVLGQHVSAERSIVVYDLGAGTFDVSVVRPSLDGFEVVASDGLPDVGGLDLDAAVVRHARTLTAGASEAWQRLDWPHVAADQQARQMLWSAARLVKEQLSRHASGDLHVPLVDQQVHLTREEFEKMAALHLDRTAALTLAVLRRCGVPPEDVAGVFLVGGSSRIPLAATLLHRMLRISPTVIDQPELVVAEGALCIPEVADVGIAAGWPATGGAAVKTVDGGRIADAHGRDPRPRGQELDPQRTIRLGSTSPNNAESSGPGPAGTVADQGGPDAANPYPPDRELNADSSGLWEATEERSRSHETEPLVIQLKGWLMRPQRVNALAWHPTGGRLAVAATGIQVRVYDNAGAEQFRLHADPSGIQGSRVVAFDPDGARIATGGGEGVVRVWDTATATRLLEIRHRWAVRTVVFSPGGARLATASGSPAARIWDARTGHRLMSLTHALGRVTSVAFSADGSLVATGSSDSTVRVWDAATGRRLRTLRHGRAVLAVAFSRRGTQLATGSRDRRARLWDAATGELLLTLPHERGVRALTFAENGTRLATASGDRTARVWDTATGHLLLTLDHPDRVWTVAFSPDDKHLATGGDRGVIRIWPIDLAALA
jgi:WD40 repeat protein/actin-like ATPase involved in cell morphogenesis